jgi:hypothetical protein
MSRIQINRFRILLRIRYYYYYYLYCIIYTILPAEL